MIYHEQRKKTSQNIRAVLPSNSDCNCGPPDATAAPASSSKGKTSSVSGVNGYPAHWLFFFLMDLPDTLCHLKTIFLTASAQTEGNYHVANQVRHFRESRPSEGFMSFTFSGVAGVFWLYSEYSQLGPRHALIILQQEHFSRSSNAPRTRIQSLTLPWLPRRGAGSVSD